MDACDFLAEDVRQAEGRIERQLRLVAELDRWGRQEDALRARELLGVITETANALHLHLGTVQRF